MTNEWNSRISMWMEMLKKTFYQPVEGISFCCFTTGEQLNLEEVYKQEFQPAEEGICWGKEWEYTWFKAVLKTGKWAEGKRIVMDLNLGGEATLFVNGECFGCRRDDWILEQHHFICDNVLTQCAEGNEMYEVLAECYGGQERPHTEGECASGPFFRNKKWKRSGEGYCKKVLGESTFGIWREEAYHLYLEVKALDDVRKNLDPGDLRACEIEDALQEFTKIVDFEAEEEKYLETVKKCRDWIRPYLVCSNGSTMPVMHAIGHAHIDLEWLWPLEETKRKCARTMAAQIRHMDAYPEYKMILSQPYLYELIKKHYPALYKKMLHKVQNGQLIPEGGMWVEADTNLPSGESLIRQFLYGKKFFREEFHVESRLLWLPDVFGYSGALPQIMKGCGITYFSTHKIFWTYNGGDPFPYHYFDWKGIDGTKIPTFIHVEYSSPTDGDTIINRWKSRAQKTKLKRFLMPFGYGDGGGGATRDHIENCRIFADMEGVPKVKFDHPNRFFEVIHEDYPGREEYSGELYYQAHRGTYTSQAKTKQGNRKCEFALREAEIWNGIAAIYELQTHPSNLLEENWKKLLLNQFHDILPGSSIHRVYERAEKDYQEISEICRDLTRKAAVVLAGTGTDTVVFNSLSWERKSLIPIPSQWEQVCDGEGKELTIQRNGDRAVCELTIPSIGTNIIRRMKNEKKITELKHVMVQAETDPEIFLENKFLRILFNSHGEIVRILDKETESEWTRGMCNQLLMYQDIPGHFEAWDVDSMYREVPVALESKAEFQIVEKGPLFAQIQFKRQLHDSFIIQDIRLTHDSRRIDFFTKIDWKEAHKLLKAAFPVNIVTDEMISEIQYGFIKRPNHKSRIYDKDRFEVCNHKWSAMAEANRGCAILNDAKYGISNNGSCMELTLLKAPTFPDETADLGMQEFCYSFTCWNDSFLNAGFIREAFEQNVSPVVIGGNGEKVSYFSVDSPYIMIDIVKIAEAQDALVIRMYESKGAAVKCSLFCRLQIEEAVQTNMLEEDERGLVWNEVDLPNINYQDGRDGCCIALDFTPHEIKTVLLRKRK